MKLLKWILGLGAVILLLTAAINYPKLNIISGFAAKNMASSMYIAKRSPESIKQNDHRVPLISLAETSPGPTANSTSARVFGLMERRASCSPGLGCLLLPDGKAFPADRDTPAREMKKSALPYPFGHANPKDSLFPEVRYDLLESAIDRAFERPETQRTRTVLVLYRNHLLAERYGPGFRAETPVLGWSMSKCVLATLYGILEYRDAFNVKEQAGVAEWAEDDRKKITYDDLLRMQSGLEWDEDYSQISDVTRMLFLESDMSATQLMKKAEAPPGAVWNYSSGTSNLLSGLLRRRFNNYQEYLDFPYRELIDKIGMHSMLLETDLEGNFVGSSYCWASTRDWGKFGLLYLMQGEWDGEQLFHPSWIPYVTRPTKDSEGDYGAHFWLNAGGKYPAAPPDMYSANGYQGQYVFIIPSRDLVIVRTGLAEPPDFDVNGFLRDILAAVGP